MCRHSAPPPAVGAAGRRGAAGREARGRRGAPDGLRPLRVRGGHRVRHRPAEGGRAGAPECGSNPGLEEARCNALVLSRPRRDVWTVERRRPARVPSRVAAPRAQQPLCRAREQIERGARDRVRLRRRAAAVRATHLRHAALRLDAHTSRPGPHPLLAQACGPPCLGAGFEYAVEYNKQGLPKPGYLATSAGATLDLCYEPELPPAPKLERLAGASGVAKVRSAWSLGYLMSYEVPRAAARTPDEPRLSAPRAPCDSRRRAPGRDSTWGSPGANASRSGSGAAARARRASSTRAGSARHAPRPASHLLPPRRPGLCPRRRPAHAPGATALPPPGSRFGRSRSRTSRA